MNPVYFHRLIQNHNRRAQVYIRQYRHTFYIYSFWIQLYIRIDRHQVFPDNTSFHHKMVVFDHDGQNRTNLKILDSNLIGSLKNHYDNFQNLQSEKLSKKTFIFDGWKYYIPAFGCHWIKICDVQVRLNSSFRASRRLSFAHESDQNWIFRLFIDTHVWFFDAFGDQSSNTSNLLHFKNGPKVFQEWFTNGPKVFQKLSKYCLKWCQRDLRNTT